VPTFQNTDNVTSTKYEDFFIKIQLMHSL